MWLLGNEIITTPHYQGMLDKEKGGTVRSEAVQLGDYSHSLLTLAFVACSTNVGEHLVKLITCYDVPGHWWVDVWRSGTSLLHSCKTAF